MRCSMFSSTADWGWTPLGGILPTPVDRGTSMWTMMGSQGPTLGSAAS